MAIDRGSTPPTVPETVTEPRLIKNLPPVKSTISLDYMTTSTGHNTYRPDIYRTSEGYLN